MRRIARHSWWLVGLAVIAGVVSASLLMRHSDEVHQQTRQRAVQREVQQALASSVGDVLSRERALARVIGNLRSPDATPWPVLSNIVTGQSVANGAGFVEPVSQRELARFQRRTGITLVESPRPGVTRPAAARPLHMVLVDSSSTASHTTAIGLDLASSRVRAAVMLEAARSGRQVATPPVRFIGPTAHGYGVVVYAPVRNPSGRLVGWVTAGYRASVLARMATAHLTGARLRIEDGNDVLYSDYLHPGGTPSTLTVAGRHWRIWARPASPATFSSSWIVLGLGLGLAALISLILRQASTRESYAMGVVAERDAEDAALNGIATLVAKRADPAAIFARVAEQSGTLLDSLTALVSRFDPGENRGVVVGAWTNTGVEFVGTEFALDGDTASARVYRTGQLDRSGTYDHQSDAMSTLLHDVGGRVGLAAPIVVGSELWGAISASYASDAIPPRAEERLDRFASLVGLAISNSDAWDRLERQASTDALTGLANRRSFDERLRSELTRVRRYERELAVALLDIDHFKRINDRHGHQRGDGVLLRLAQILREHARDGDLVARVGGEEFAWIMPETDSDGALNAVERMRQMFAEERFQGIGRVTVSIGLRAAHEAHTVESLVWEADHAMYSAKAKGRNATHVYLDDPQIALAGLSATEPSAADTRPPV